MFLCKSVFGFIILLSVILPNNLVVTNGTTSIAPNETTLEGDVKTPESVESRFGFGLGNIFPNIFGQQANQDNFNGNTANNPIFQPAVALQGPFGQQTPGGSRWNPNTNQGPQNQVGFPNQAGSQNQGGPLNQDGFQNQANQVGFPNQAGFQNQGGPLNQAGFQNQAIPNQVGFPNQGGPPNQAGFQNPGRFPNQAEYQNPGRFQNQAVIQNPAGFPNQGRFPDQTGFQNQGGFPQDPQGSQFGNPGQLTKPNQSPNERPFQIQRPFQNQGPFQNQRPLQNQDQLFSRPGSQQTDQNWQTAPGQGNLQMPNWNTGINNQNINNQNQAGTVDQLIPQQNFNTEDLRPNDLSWLNNGDDQTSPDGDTLPDNQAGILGNPVFVQTTPAGDDPIIDDSSTENPAQIQCVQDCRTTSEYNPLCGSNNVTYFNPARFECARNCGINVSVLRRGRCYKRRTGLKDEAQPRV